MRVFFLFASGRPVARHHLWKTSIKGLDAGGAGSGPGTRVASVRLLQGSCHLSALPDLGTRGSCHRRSPAVRAWAVRGLLGVSAGHSGSKTPCRPHSRLRLTPEERRAVGSTALFPVASWWVPGATRGQRWCPSEAGSEAIPRGDEGRRVHGPPRRRDAGRGAL